MLAFRHCPVCTSNFTVHLQDVWLQRQQKMTAPQFYCMGCESFFHESNYREDDGQLGADARFLVRNADRSAEAIVQFLSAQGDIESVYEAGCGVGSTLNTLRDAGFTVAGVDPNQQAIDHARGMHRLNVDYGHFLGLDRPVDAIIAIDVMEHLTAPREFFGSLVSSVRPGGLIIVRVPLVNRNQWHWLKTASQVREKNFSDPFFDNSVHITHFSERGLLAMAADFGVTFERVTDVGWYYVFRKATACPQAIAAE